MSVNGRANPVIVDFGEQPAKRVKLLQKGKGRLVEDLDDTVSQLRTDRTISETAQVVVFVVTRQND